MKFKTSYKLATLFLNKYSWKEIDAIPRRFFSHWICWKVGSSFWENTASQASYSTCILLLSIAQSMAFCCLNLSCTTGSRWMVINRERRLVKVKLHQLNLGLVLTLAYCGLLFSSRLCFCFSKSRLPHGLEVIMKSRYAHIIPMRIIERQSRHSQQELS